MGKTLSPEEALQKAIAIAGCKARLAAEVGVTAQALGQWSVTPPLRVLAVSNATGGKIPPHALRPDIYPKPMEDDHGSKERKGKRRRQVEEARR